MERIKISNQIQPGTTKAQTPKNLNLPETTDISLKYPKTYQPLDLEKEITFTIKSLHKKIKKSSDPQKIPLNFTILTNDIKTDKNRAGLDLILIIDTSGSMGGKKLKSVKKTLFFIIENLTEIDRLSLINFSDEAKFLSPLKPMNEENKYLYKRLVKRLDASGETDIKGAVEMGLEVFLRRKFVNEISSIFFLSDGKNTEGGSLKDLEDLMREKDSLLKKKGMGYKIHSFGYGKEHDENWLSFISDFKDGNFYYVKTNELIHECFIDCLGELLSTIATNCKITIFLDKKCKFVTKFGESWKDKSNNETGVINVQNIISDMDKDFIGEVKISEITDSDEKIKIAIGILSYENDKGIKSSKTVNLILDVSKDGNLGEVNQGVLENLMKMEAGKKIQDFEKLADQGKLKEAEKIIKKFNNKVKTSTMNGGYKKKLNEIMDVKKMNDKKMNKQITKVMFSDQYAPGYTNLKRQRGNASRMLKKI